TERRFVITLSLRKIAVIGLVLAGKKISGDRNLGIGGSRQAGECIAVNLAVADHLFGNVGFMVERGRGRRDIRSTDRPGTVVNRTGASSVDMVDRRFRNGVSILANVILDPVLILANRVRPDRPSILKVNDVRA